jgi:hypothetical protein
MSVNGPYGLINQDKFEARLIYVTAGKISYSNINLIPILRPLAARCTTCHCRKMSFRSEKLFSVFASQEVKSVVNWNDSFGVTARGIQQFLGIKLYIHVSSL